MSDNTRPRIDYGIDAPGLVRKFFVVGSVALFLALASGLSPWPGNRWGMVVASVFGMAYGLHVGNGMPHAVFQQGCQAEEA